MEIEGAIVNVQGMTFALVMVEELVLDSETEREQAIYLIESLFAGLPIVLMAQDVHGSPRYWGRLDIVRLAQGLKSEEIVWQHYDVTD